MFQGEVVRITRLRLRGGQSHSDNIGAPDAASALAATPTYAVRFANADNVVTGVQWQASTGRLALGTTLQVQ